MNHRNLFLFALLTYFALGNLNAQLIPVVDSIQMSDGKKLAADIYIPSGMTKGPVILIQTPYNRQLFRFSLPMGVGLNINSSNYIFVVTDWRGFYGSKNANYIGSPDRGKDGYSTVEWIAAQSWSNGKVGTWGASALGKVQYQTAKTHPPHLVCINPLVAAPQFEYQEYYQGGALRTEYLEQLDALGYGLSPFIMAHPYFDFTWVATESTNSYPDSIAVPCFMIGGWYDHNIRLMLNFFDLIRQRSPSNVRDVHKLLMGPWEHGGKGNARVGTSTQGQLSYPNAQNKNDSMSLQFFDFYLRGMSNGWDNVSKITYYQMGENKWNTTTVWPPSGGNVADFFLHADGTINSSIKGTGTDSTKMYAYSPVDPSPTVGGCTLRNDLDQGPFDQSPVVESRSDVLIFSTDVLTKELVVKGIIKVQLKVSSSRVDTDFDIRLTDVYPDGKSMLVNDGVYRMRFLKGFSSTDVQMLTPGNIYTCTIELPATCLTFLPGHRLRVVVSSSNYPKYNRNMNNGANMYPGNSMDSVNNPMVAANTVHMGTVNFSKISLPLYDYSGSVSDILASQRKLQLWPNPGTEILNLGLEKFDADCTIEVRDLTGRLIAQLNREQAETMEVSAWTKGIYLITVRDSQGLSTAKFVKE